MSVGKEKRLAAAKEATKMAETGKENLQKNPVVSYRDPFTGYWRIEKAISEQEEQEKNYQLCGQRLRPNPLKSYRDPTTGQWVAVKP